MPSTCSWLPCTIARTLSNSGLVPSISAERCGCSRTIAHSSSLSGPILVMISSGTTLMPRSRKRLAVASCVSSFEDRPMRRPTSRTRMSSSVSPGATGSAVCSAGGGAALPRRDNRDHTNDAGIHWSFSSTRNAKRSTRSPSTTNRPSCRRALRMRRSDSVPRAREASPVGSVSHSATRAPLSDRPSSESPGDTSTRRAVQDAIRSPSSRSMAARGSSLWPPSTSASTTGPDTIRSSRPTDSPESAGFRRNGSTGASSRGRGVVLIGILVRRHGLHLRRGDPVPLCGLDQRAPRLLERRQHRSLRLRGARHQLVGLVPAGFRLLQDLGYAGLGLGIAVGERLLEALALLPQLLLDLLAQAIALLAGLVHDLLGVSAGLVDVTPPDAGGVLDQALTLGQDVVDLERTCFAQVVKLVLDETLERLDGRIHGLGQAAQVGVGTLGDDRLGQARHRRLTGRLVGDALDQHQLRLSLGLGGHLGLMPAVVIGGNRLLIRLDLGDGLVHVVRVVFSLDLRLLSDGLILKLGGGLVPMLRLRLGLGYGLLVTLEPLRLRRRGFDQLVGDRSQELIDLLRVVPGGRQGERCVAQLGQVDRAGCRVCQLREEAIDLLRVVAGRGERERRGTNARRIDHCEGAS